MSAAIIAVAKKIIVYLLSSSKTRGGVFVAIGSIIAGLLGLMCLPAIVTMALQNRSSELPEIDKSMFNEAAYLSSLDSSQQAELMNLQEQGQAIENAMTAENVRPQTIKAQLIYLSHFENVQDFDAEFYAKLFAASPDDESLINVLNYAYRLDIDYAEFMRTYTFVMNATINRYMFETPETKNGTDLAAWAENAYISGWDYKENAVGECDEESRIRCADSAGLILGYLRYDTEQKMFNSEPSNFCFNSKGGLDTMPEKTGVILSNGDQL